MKKYCIIVAGGSGKRMKSAVPKQFLLLDGRPVLMHSIERFHSFDNTIEIILVLPTDSVMLWKDLVREHSFEIRHEVVCGGEQRYFSVKEGLAKIKDEGLVAVHDGVRPLVSHDTIWRCFADAEEYGTAVPFIEPADSVRLLAGEESRPVPRGDVRLIQTPQVFRSNIILKAYRQDYNPAFTDDATVVEASGKTIHLTHGNRDNIKITTPEDLIVAGTLLKAARQQ